ncbi:LamG-like jellyroll fold domain-containing protein [uncultured Rikenella sp.]|uniref:LamG-like jellyroll fold domain-containing protein n=1 Tax=uncultured Rikenella sp. TaxID=368003 RepID=UPI002631C522|nr:LamG-like jellyroll fold domain-containing protein [uncultured Rikenella sp.]
MIRGLFFVLFSLGVYDVARGAVTPVLHYNFGKAGNVTYAVAPRAVRSSTGGGELLVVGQPVFYADAPGDRKMKGEGSILFDGKRDGYRLREESVRWGDNRLLEVWVKAADTGREAVQTVVALGDGAESMTLGQRGDKWVFLCGAGGAGGAEEVEIGEAVADRWVHLAAVVERGRGAVWMDGRKSGEFLFEGAVAPILSVAVDAEGGRAFRGSIYEIRYGTFADGAFSPETDLSLHAMRSEVRTTRSAEARAALVAQLEAPGYGKEVVRTLSEERQQHDWLIRPVRQASRLYVRVADDRQDVRFRLDNGLVSRTFYLGDNIACISYKNKSDDTEYLRAVKPEARIRIDTTWYDVGGLAGQPEMSYLLEEWLPQMTAAPGAFVLEKIETGVPVERYPWSRKFHAPAADWPPKGLRLTLTFAAPGDVPQVKGVEVRVHYEIYDGLPVIAKWIEVVNDGARELLLRDMECEVLAVNQDRVSRMHVESDYSFALANADPQGSALMHYAGDPKAYHVGRSTTRWVPDPEYHTWASHNQAEDKFLGFPHHNLLLSKLPMGPCVEVEAGKPFRSFVTFELLHDSDDRERQSLAHRRMYRRLAPQVTESLIAAGITSHDERQLKNLIDQMK